MRTLLEKKLGDGRTIADVLFAVLPAGEDAPLVVDVGARNGFYLLPPEYTSRSSILGFEPNRREFEKLVSGTTDAARYFGEMSPFKEIRFEPYAVWGKNGEFDFYITKGAGACTMMGPTLEVTKDIFYHYSENDPRRKISLEEQHMKVMQVTKVDCRILDDLVPKDACVDFLKLDVEGGEANILAGAEELLASGRILAVRAEYQLLRYYKDHPLLHVQHRILDEAGYRLIDLETNHPRYREGRFDMPDSSGKGLIAAGDAIYIRDPDRVTLTPTELHRLGMLCICLWYNSLGLSLLERAGLLPTEDLEAIYAVARQTQMLSWRGQLVRAWAELPHRAFHAVGLLRRWLRL
jgi:FkbM family methyltransferase